MAAVRGSEEEEEGTGKGGVSEKLKSVRESASGVCILVNVSYCCYHSS